MSNWESINLSKLVPSALTDATTDISNLIDELLVLYKEAITAAKVYQASLDGGGPDILATLIQAITDLLQGLLQAGKIHALFIPMPKVFENAPAATVPPSLDDVIYDMGVSLEDAGIIFSSGAQKSYASLIDKTGGNHGFFTTFVKSLNDLYDVNRPQYLDPKDAVTMTVLMLGAPSFAGLVEVAAAFNRAFRPSANNDFTARVVPSPQNVRARVIGLPAASRIGVRLDWDPAQNSYNTPYVPAVDITVQKYAVIRSIDPAAASASCVLDFFSTQDLTVGLTSDDKAQSSKVIAIGSGTNASYVDDDASLDKNTVYYYCVAWQIQITEQGTPKILKWDRVSNVVKTRVRAVLPSQQGIPPDWTAYGSMLDLVPDVAVQVESLIEQIKILGARNSGGASSSVLKGLSLLEANIDAFATRIDQLNARAKKLNAIFGQPLPGLYTTSITGVGGNAFLIGELAARLDDTSDPNRPPYDDNEYVMGICLVAGGPRIPDIQPIIDFLALLFQPAASTNPVLNALNGLGGVVQQQETFTFGQNSQALPADPANPGNVILPDGTSVPAGSIDPTTGLPAVAPAPAIADDGTAVAGNDPANANSGNTGVVPIKC